MGRIARGLALSGVGLTAAGFATSDEDPSVLARGIRRTASAAACATLIVADYKLFVGPPPPPGSSPDTDSAYRAALSLAHERGAERLLQLCLNNGGLYLKAGQHLATLRYALPDQYTSALSAQLFDSAVTMPFSTVCQTICDELGVKDVHDVFVSVDSEPLAAASLAQVHRATLRGPGGSAAAAAAGGAAGGGEGGEGGGEELLDVVIKVQFPNLASDTRGDLAAFGIISRQVALVFPQVDLAWLLPEFESNMNQEMDFDREADNIERVTAMFQPPSPTGQTGPPPGKKKDDPATDAAAAAAAATGTACGLFAGRIAVPKVYRAVSSKGVLVMEWIDGHRVNDMDAHAACGFEPEEVMDLDSFAHLIWGTGFVHGDPHPGNLLVRRAPGDSGIAKGGSSSAGVSRQPQPPQLVLLDHGLYRDLGESFRANYCSLWTSFITGDAQRLVAAASALDIRPEYHELLSVILAVTLIRIPKQKDHPAAAALQQQQQAAKPEKDQNPAAAAETGSSSGGRGGGGGGEKIDSKEEEEAGGGGGQGGSTIMGRLSDSDRAYIKTKMVSGTSLGDVNSFSESLPRTMLLVMRTHNLLGSLGRVLAGGDLELGTKFATRRLERFGRAAIRGLHFAPGESATVWNTVSYWFMLAKIWIGAFSRRYLRLPSSTKQQPGWDQFMSQQVEQKGPVA